MPRRSSPRGPRERSGGRLDVGAAARGGLRCMATATASRPDAGPRILAAGAVGALVAVSLGIYGNVHDPASDLSITLGFSDTITMKVWLASVAVLFGVVQVVSALSIYGKLGRKPP